MFNDSILNASVNSGSSKIVFSSLRLIDIEDDIKALEQKLGEKFASLSISSKLALLGMCTAYNQVCENPGKHIIDELVGTNGLGLLSLINPVSLIPGRLFAERLIQYYHSNGINFDFYDLDVMALKAGNDLSQHGQEGGDMLLRRFAFAFQELLYVQDPFALLLHIGGDEFLVLSTSGIKIDVDLIKRTIALVDNQDIVDQSNIKVMKTFFKASDFFKGTKAEEFYHLVNKDLLKRQFLFKICYLRSRLGALPRFANLLQVVIYFLLYTLPKVINFRFKRDSDLEWVLKQEYIQEFARQHLPNFRIRFCSYAGSVDVSAFESFKPLMEFINYAPLLKEENRGVKETAWSNNSLEALFLDLRGEHRGVRRQDKK
jgi:GGDEF domain-containing protein